MQSLDMRRLHYDEPMAARTKNKRTGKARNPASHAVPVLSGQRGLLTLHFGSNYIQSQMRVNEPDFLALAYTRTMMSFESFLAHPREIALIGLGGGSIAKWCHRHHPQAKLTVVEINPHVIAVRDAFRIPPDSERLRILCADGAAFLADPPLRYDLLLIDCFTSNSAPPALSSQVFFDNCRAALTPNGLMVANLCFQRHRAVLSRIRKSFRGQVLLSTDRDGNTVTFACKGKLLWPQGENQESFGSRLKAFEQKYALRKALVPR
jgi:spermidine synthase